MIANPFLGVFFHWLGGLAAGSFYVPYRGVRKWAWEVYWLVGGFSWIIAPWVVASVNTRDLLGVLGQTSGSTFAWTWFWGAIWGLGGLTFGLTMRYLGMSLGMAVALGYCAAFGTLMPPIFHGEFVSKVLATASGRFILLGVGVCLAGIAIAGWAGMSKERETTEDERKSLRPARALPGSSRFRDSRTPRVLVPISSVAYHLPRCGPCCFPGRETPALARGSLARAP